MKSVFVLFLLTIFIFSNSLYYSLCLLFLVFSLLSFLFSNYYISSLTLLIFFIVYIGAIIILIGYVCAVCPNILVKRDVTSFSLLFFSFLFTFFLFELPFSKASSRLNYIVSFFYRLHGVFLFFTLIFMLFLTLLIVTTYYYNPKGPFRSIS